MKLLFAGGAAIPALALTVIVGAQYSSTPGSEPTDPAPVAAQGEPGAGTCTDGEDCDAYVAGRDGELSPPDAPLASNLDPAAMLDLLMQQTGGGQGNGGGPGSAGFLCSSPFDCLDDLPGPGDLPLPTFAFSAGSSLQSIDGGQEGEPLELVGHGTRDSEFGGAPGAAGSGGPNAGDEDGQTDGPTGGPGGGTGADYLNAGGSAPSWVGGSAAPPEGNQGGGNSGSSPGSGDEPAADDDPVTSSDTTVKEFVEESLIGDDDSGGSGGGSQGRQAFGGGDESQDDSNDGPGGTAKGPAFDDVLDQFGGGDDEDEYAGLRSPDDGGNTDLTPSEVPEPASMMMFGTGLLLAVAHLRRRGKQAR